MGGFNTWHSSDSDDDDDPGIKDVEIVQVTKTRKRVLDDIGNYWVLFIFYPKLKLTSFFKWFTILTVFFNNNNNS